MFDDDGERRPEVGERVVASGVQVQAGSPGDVAEGPDAGCRLRAQDRSPGEPVADGGVVQEQRREVLDLAGDRSDDTQVGQRGDPGATDRDAAAEEAVARRRRVEAQQGLPQPLRVDGGQPEADVAGERTDVGDVVVHPLELEEEGPDRSGLVRDDSPGGILDGHREGKRVAHRGVPADPLGQRDALGRVPAGEQPLDPPVHEPQPRLHAQDGLADDREPEVARFDQPRMDRPDRDLVHAVALDF